MPSLSHKGEFWYVNKHAYVEDLLEKNYFPVFQWELNHTDNAVKNCLFQLGNSWTYGEGKREGLKRDQTISLCYWLPSYTKTWNTKSCVRGLPWFLVFRGRGKSHCYTNGKFDVFYVHTSDYYCVPTVLNWCYVKNYATRYCRKQNKGD